MEKTIRKLEDLEVYTISYNLALEILKLTTDFPRKFQYSIVDQLTRASTSIAANISEGFAKRRYANVFKHHLNIAIGSLSETKTWLDFSKDLKMISTEDHLKLIVEIKKLAGMIYNLEKRWKSR